MPEMRAKSCSVLQLKVRWAYYQYRFPSMTRTHCSCYCRHCGALLSHVIVYRDVGRRREGVISLTKQLDWRQNQGDVSICRLRSPTYKVKQLLWNDSDTGPLCRFSAAQMKSPRLSETLHQRYGDDMAINVFIFGQCRASDVQYVHVRGIHGIVNSTLELLNC